MNEIIITDPRRDTVGSVIDALAQLNDERLCTAEDVLLAINFHDRLKQVSNDLGKQLNAAACKFIKANGDIICGTVRYYVGVDKTVKCKDVKGTLELMLSSAEGDMDRVAACLSSDAWKHGACKEVLGDKVWAEAFETTSKDKLEEGKAPKQPSLKKIDTKFLKPKKLGK